MAVQQLCDVVIQLLGQRGDIRFRIRRCDRVGRARNVHSYFINHRILTLRTAQFRHGGRVSNFPVFRSHFRDFRAQTRPRPKTGARLFRSQRNFSANCHAATVLPRLRHSPLSSYYNIKAAQEKVLNPNFQQICQKDGAKNSSNGKNWLFSLHSRPELIIMISLCSRAEGKRRGSLLR